MNRKRLLCLLLAVMLLCLGACGQAVEPPAFAPAPSAAPAADQAPTAEASPAPDGSAVPAAGSQRTIRIFETSDIHGYLLDTSGGEEEKFQYRLAYIAQVVNDARASGKYDDVLLVDGGDLYQGMPVSNLTMGAAVIAALDAMDYDAVALGNHEFDWGVSEYCADADATLPAYQIGDFSGDPEIPVLAYNLYFADTHQRVPFTKDYVIAEKAGLRVALIGYIPDYSDSIMHEKVSPYVIDEDLAALSARVKEINAAESPDVTIVMAHAMPVKVAEALSPEDVDLVTGGHKHNGIYGVAESGVPYIQSDCYAQGYASATIVVEEDGTVRIEEPLYTSITEDKSALFDTPENAEHLDDTVLAISHLAWDEISDEMQEVLGYIDTPLEKKGYVGAHETSGGNWFTGLMLRATASDGVVAAFYNRGGVRASFTIPKGETRRVLTVEDVYAIAPFNNFWLIFDLTGEELAKQIENGFLQSSFGDQMSGLTYTYINHGTKDNPDIEVVSITLSDGTEVDVHDTTKLYRVCTSNYNATVPGGVFEGKEPLYPEAEAPLDNLTMIVLLRQEARDNDGYIAVDTSPRGTCIEGEVPDPPA